MRARLILPVIHYQKEDQTLMKPLYLMMAARSAIALTACETTPSVMTYSDEAAIDPKTGEGLYFPPITDTETEISHYSMMVDASPVKRQFFADLINMETSGRGMTAPIVIQVTGENKAVLVVMVPDTDRLLTPYTARALLARMTSIIRFAPAVAEMGLSEELDIYHVAAVLGFNQIIVTDGSIASYATEIELQPISNWSSSVQLSPSQQSRAW